MSEFNRDDPGNLKNKILKSYRFNLHMLVSSYVRVFILIKLINIDTISIMKSTQMLLQNLEYFNLLIENQNDLRKPKLASQF